MINKHINTEALERMVTQGYVMKNKHPELPLWIYNYTQSTQYNGVWNDTTIQCRGLILDENYTVIARPLPKFFNIEEAQSANLPQLPFEVYEKMDGSLGVLFWIENQPFISSRNSFSSEQSIKANELLQTKYKSIIKQLDTSKTYIFEIIYPENRIVVDYGKEEHLTLLAIIDTKTGHEEELSDFGFPLPKTMANVTTFEALKSLNWDNSEGFVVKFSNGFRVKIKFENYISMHKVVTQVSSIAIWEQLKSGKGLNQWVENIPDEFYNWVRKTEKKLRKTYQKIEQEAQNEYKELPTKKETALYFKRCKHKSILFAMYNKKQYDSIIWKKVKPPFEKAFQQVTI